MKKEKLKTIENVPFVDDIIIENLYQFLKETKMDKFAIRTTKVKGCWGDNELDASIAGFDIYRFTSQELSDRYEYSGCYMLTRRSNKSK